MSQRRCTERTSFPIAAALARHRLGENRALDELVRACGPTMAAAARRYVNTSEDAADAVQEAWVAFIRSQHTITQPERTLGWLCVTTARAALAIALRQHRCEAVAAERIDRLRRPWLDDEVDLVDDGRRGTVRLAVGRLSRQEQELVDLLISDDAPSYAVISANTGRAIGSIGPTRQRVVAKLRRDPAIQALATDAAA